MDYNLAIERHKRTLVTIVARLIVMIGNKTELHPATIRSARRILLPAEAALRRLIFILAMQMKTKVRARKKPDRRGLPDFASLKSYSSERLTPFNLIDPRKSFGFGKPRRRRRRIPPHLLPRIRGFDVDPLVPQFLRGGPPQPEPPPPPPPPPPRPSPTEALVRRIERMAAALESLPRQARRLNRYLERRETAEPGPAWRHPIRMGHPPGWREKGKHEADAVLAECHFLARELMPP